MFEYIDERRRERIYYRAIADELEERGDKSTRGRPLTAKSVERFYMKGKISLKRRSAAVEIVDVVYRLEK